MIKYEVGLVGLGVLASGVLWGCGSSDPAAPPDAQPAFAVRGTAYGLTEAVSLRLEHNGGSELLSVVEDGPFTFPTMLSVGESYAVTLVGEPPCVLVGASGVVADADPAFDVACEGVFLDALLIAGATTPPVAFDPGRTDYEADVHLFQGQVSITAVPAHPDAAVTIHGTPVDADNPSVTVVLSLGENPIDVAVTFPGGETRVYHLVVRRAAELAQAAYGKASNAEAGDSFGYSLALWGDTLAVGAPAEDSAATGIDGDQDDDSADGAGAVYVFLRTGSSWAQQAYLKGSNTGAGDAFGFSVALYGDTLAVGAIREDSGATGVGGSQNDDAFDNGAVYLFQRANTSWKQEGYLKASNSDREDMFGSSVALSLFTLAAGARHEDSMATDIGGDQDDDSAGDSGAIYLFQ